MKINGLEVSNWRQFRDVRITFDDQLTVITGANGAGKTTLLSLLAQHFGWPATFVSTPRRLHTGTGSYVYSADKWDQEYMTSYQERMNALDADEDIEIDVPVANTGPQEVVGKVKYSDGGESTLVAPVQSVPVRHISYLNQKQIHGLHILSHRLHPPYRPVATIPATPRRRHELFNGYVNLIRIRTLGQALNPSVPTPFHFIKESLIGLAAFGYASKVSTKNQEFIDLFEEFQSILRVILPKSLGFKKLQIRLPEVVLITKTGDFSIDAVSGGIEALIDIAWQIFTCADKNTEFVATIDEPENHLHPELQQSVLVNLMKAFPNVQFICGSHSPFIVTSVKNSKVYALKYDESLRVVSHDLEIRDRAGTPNEILRDVLGVESTAPLWVQEDLHKAEEAISGAQLSAESLERLRALLREKGLERLIPEAISSLSN